jgi:hypothetical protein
MQVFLNDISHYSDMCFDYEFPELEKDLLKSTKQKKNIEPERLKERPIVVTV